MRSKFLLLALGTALSACANQQVPDVPAAGMTPVNVPVVNHVQYVYDAAAPGGSLAPGEAERLDGWFRGLDVRYGDDIYVDGSGPAAREQVAVIAAAYGLEVRPGAPVTAGPVGPETARVVVGRAEAGVPNCPNWSVPSQPNFANALPSNYGCGVNSNIAAMVANPDDLIHGRENTVLTDARTATKPVSNYRNAAPTGNAGLMDISTKGSK
jgi:pilus assembly protein CpaD